MLSAFLILSANSIQFSPLQTAVSYIRNVEIACFHAEFLSYKIWTKLILRIDEITLQLITGLSPPYKDVKLRRSFKDDCRYLLSSVLSYSITCMVNGRYRLQHR